MITKPLPFTKAPLTWAQSFGGPGFAANPVGKGYKARELPSVELPGDIVRSWGDTPAPAGFGPINPAWPQRAGKMGKEYGSAYRKERMPYYAEERTMSPGS